MKREWTQETIRHAIALHESGSSMASVAIAVGFSRNAVIGKLYRLRQSGDYVKHVRVLKRATRQELAVASKHLAERVADANARRRKAEAKAAAATLEASL